MRLRHHVGLLGLHGAVGVVRRKEMSDGTLVNLERCSEHLVPTNGSLKRLKRVRSCWLLRATWV